MPDLKFIKAHGGLVPFGPDAEAWLAKTKLGQLVEGVFKRPRNDRFHRKYFALLNYAFENWDVDETKAAKNFDKFRSDLTIMAGYHEQVWSPNSEMRLVAKSISFAAMEQDEFDALYSDTVNIIIGKILDTHTEEDIDRVMNELLGFI